MKSSDETEWVEVAATGQDEEAALIAGLLQSQDIPCEVEAPSGGSPWPENLGAFGVSRVMVPPERAAEARELIARREREFRQHPMETGSETPDDESE
jgi:Putative prokaryotic signal transducing protein